MINNLSDWIYRQSAPRATGMILDMGEEDFQNSIKNLENLKNKIAEAYELVKNTREADSSSLSSSTYSSNVNNDLSNNTVWVYVSLNINSLIIVLILLYKLCYLFLFASCTIIT